jgi:hypothetical protein
MKFPRGDLLVLVIIYFALLLSATMVRGTCFDVMAAVKDISYPFIGSMYTVAPLWIS